MRKLNLSSPRLTRRSALQVGGAAGALALLGVPSLAAAPRRGGRMIMASRHGSTTDSTDPALLTNGFQWLLAFAFSSTLTEVLPDGTVGPALAESWDSTDGKAWSFKLRRGVTFHDGRTMTPDDVVASLNYHRSPDSKSFVKPIADQFEEIRADGPDSVLIIMKSANADLPASLNTPAFTIYPASDSGIDWQSQNGTGGYILKNYEPGVRAYLERNPNFWRDDRAFAEEVELLCVEDPAARINALITGQVQAIDDVDLKTVSLLKRQSGITVEEVTGPLHYSFPMRTDVAPFDDVNVRLALKYALDREDLLEKVLLGHGHLGNDTPIGPSYRYQAEKLEQRTYDPDKARHHLKLAGLDRLQVDLSTAEAAFAGATDAAVLYAEHAREAGIDINVVREPSDGYWDNVWMNKPFCAAYWGGYPTEGEMFAIGYAPGAAWNDTYWTDETFESLRIAALSELDTTKRREMYAEMQRILHDEGGALIFAFANFVMARNDSIAHGAVSSSDAFDGRRAVERWWVTE